ncbi:unnamed protein product, partial [Medioppia subpectinata]
KNNIIFVINLKLESWFVLRQQTLSLYKDFLKLIRRTDNHKELKDWIRDEFRQNIHHKQQVCARK